MDQLRRSQARPRAGACVRPAALLERGEHMLGIGRNAVEDNYAEIQSSREIPASFKMVLMRLTSTSSP